MYRKDQPSLLQFISDKAAAVRYFRATQVQVEIIKNASTFVKPENRDALAEKIVRSLVPYQFDWSRQSRKYNILFAAKGVFNDDVKAAFSGNKNFACFQYSRLVNRSFAEQFFPKGTHHWNYSDNTGTLAKSKVLAQSFHEDMLPRILRKMRFDAYLCGNFGAYDEQPLAIALEKRGIPFMALHKECTISPGISEYLLQAFIKGRDAYRGSRLFVYNEVARKQIRDSNLCDPDIIEVLGMPRLDVLHNIRKSRALQRRKPRENHIGCFFPSIDAQLPTLIDKSIDMGWHELTYKTCQSLYNTATKNPEIKITVKPKAIDANVAFEIFQKFGDLPANLVINPTISASSLIRKSSVVCAFNSTAMLEAFAAGVPCVSPDFGETQHPEYQPFLLDFGDAPISCKSPIDLEEAMVSCAQKPIPAPNILDTTVVDVLQHWTNNPDGDLSITVSKRMAEIIDGRRHSKSSHKIA